MTGGRGVELGEHALLDVHALRHGLDDEVDVPEPVVGGAAVDPAKDLVDLGLRLLGGDLALLGELADLPLGDPARLVKAGLNERLLDVLQDDRDAGGRDRLGDLPAHGPCADDRCLEHEHAGYLLC